MNSINNRIQLHLEENMSPVLPPPAIPVFAQVVLAEEVKNVMVALELPARAVATFQSYSNGRSLLHRAHNLNLPDNIANRTTR